MLVKYITIWKNDRKYVIVHMSDNLVYCAERLKVYSRPITFIRNDFESALISGRLRQMPTNSLAQSYNLTQKGKAKLESDWEIVKFIQIDNITLYVNDSTRNELLSHAEQKFNVTRQKINYLLQKYYWNGFIIEGLLDVRYFNSLNRKSMKRSDDFIGRPNKYSNPWKKKLDSDDIENIKKICEISQI